jgi:predicted N-acetyltransferase YhbS
VEPAPGPADPNDYGTPRPADFAPLARDAVEIGILSQADLEGVARIDRRHTGRDRRGYLCRAVAEALADSALRVSLAARIDHSLAGYVMARLDYGDFGRAEPVAVIDTMGVDPLRAHQGVGRALLSQLFANLAALGVERVETVVAPGDLGLLGFFSAAGFRPSERLSFVKEL